MPRVRRFIHLSASPFFLVLAVLLHSNSNVAYQLCGAFRTDTQVDILGTTFHLPITQLGSMWAMYLFMAFFHCGPWLSLMARSKSYSAESCCEPEVNPQLESPSV